MVQTLHDELEGAGVNGGGHLVVGSIKFVEGMRTEVLQRLAEMIGGLRLPRAFVIPRTENIKYH